MPVCPECGTINAQGDDFCGNCGAYLAWSSGDSQAAAKATPKVTPKVTAPAEPVREEPVRQEPVREEPAPPKPARPATRPEPATPLEPATPVQPPKGPEAKAREPKAPEPRVPAPAEPDPVAVQPAKPLPPRPVVRATGPDDTQDGPPCPRCGTPNLPERRFCRRCAAPLTVTAPPPALPWWRTRWPFRRRVRIGGSGTALRRTIALLVLVALVVAGVLLYPTGERAFQDVLDKLGGTAPVAPSATSASAAVEGHPATAADDGVTNTYWGAPAVGDSLTFSFRSPFRLVDLIVHTGPSPVPEQFRQQARPIVLTLEVTDKDGGTDRRQVTLEDRPGPQTVATGISDVAQVKLTVREAAGTGPGRSIALAEVEFFKRT
ncbi:zinc ribbon domain-containing protein [Streptomyces sp. NRRL WC-3742]|uniref:zinc ribbon domain-containing protein n=1 Tax=Streptomyces sp. NRRL WC-3742 TaxID=1463934 RepID=UPI0004C85D41|nr:zinc ribbon domain-containing protein [Streptomyces sp. NRRL WC-3742]